MSLAHITASANQPRVEKVPAPVYNLALRAECPHDISVFMEISAKLGWVINIMSGKNDKMFPDTEIIFESSVSHKRLQDLLDKTPDLHTMADTVLPTELYTGIRTYGPPYKD